MHSPTVRAILKTFKTSLVPINHEMHSRSCNFLYLNTMWLPHDCIPNDVSMKSDRVGPNCFFYRVTIGNGRGLPVFVLFIVAVTRNQGHTTDRFGGISVRKTSNRLKFSVREMSSRAFLINAFCFRRDKNRVLGTKIGQLGFSQRQ